MSCDRSVVFSGYSVSSTNKTDLHDIAELLLKVALNILYQIKLNQLTLSITGHYMMQDSHRAASSSHTTHSSRIDSPQYSKSTVGCCIKFWYNMHGKDTTFLKVYAKVFMWFWLPQQRIVIIFWFYRLLYCWQLQHNTFYSTPVGRGIMWYVRSTSPKG